MAQVQASADKNTGVVRPRALERRLVELEENSSGGGGESVEPYGWYDISALIHITLPAGLVLATRTEGYATLVINPVNTGADFFDWATVDHALLPEEFVPVELTGWHQMNLYLPNATPAGTVTVSNFEIRAFNADPDGNGQAGGSVTYPCDQIIPTEGRPGTPWTS